MAQRRRKTPARVVRGLPVIQQQDDMLEPVYEPDPDGRSVLRHRTGDTLRLMLRADTITQAMHDAGREFQVRFTVAGFDVIRCTSLTQVPRAARVRDLTETQVDARRRLGAALDALGGLGSPAGSCVWHVIGLQCSIREWAMRQGWSGRPINERQAQGILIAALGTLAGHYGYEKKRP